MEGIDGVGMQRAEVSPAGSPSNAMLPRSVGLVGLGLIGGSLGLDLQALGCEVHGVTHRQVTADRALERGLVQSVSVDPQSLAGCELVILALPLNRLLAPDPVLVQALPKDAVITDVGSVKGAVLKTWGSLHPRFVASHPMAGTAEAGVEAGLRDLFKGVLGWRRLSQLPIPMHLPWWKPWPAPLGVPGLWQTPIAMTRPWP